MSQIRVKNWERFQHFKDRRPPWIKLYRDLLDDIEWFELDPVAAKGLIALWLIASEYEGLLPDSKVLSFRLRVTEQKVIDLISKLSHWLEQCDIALISDEHQDDAGLIPLARSRETEKRRDRGEPNIPVISKKQKGNKTPISDDFAISDRMRSWAKENQVHNLDAHFTYFVNAAKAKDYRYAEWDRAFMNAVLSDWAKIGKGEPTGERI